MLRCSPPVGIARRAVAQLNQESTLPDIGGYPLQLESLEASPPEQVRVHGSELA